MSLAVPADQSLVTPLPIRQILPWAAFFGLMLLIAVYFVSTEQGALSMIPGVDVHEWVHDARHLLGFPCH